MQYTVYNTKPYIFQKMPAHVIHTEGPRVPEDEVVA